MVRIPSKRKPTSPPSYEYEEISGLKRACTMPNVVFRLLCPISHAGSVLGKGGEVIAKLRSETDARIKMEDRVPSCEERVVTISSPDEGPADMLCPAQVALLRLHDITSSVNPENGVNMHDASNGSTNVTCRLLVASNFVGPLVGKQGSVIKAIRESSGANVRILQDVPACSQLGDEVVQIVGDAQQVNDALEQVSANIRVASKKPSSAAAQPAMQRLGYIPNLFSAPPSHMLRPAPGTPPGPDQVETSFRMLVSGTRVGLIIGKAGDQIKALRRETGAFVKVHDQQGDADDRVVELTSIDDCHAPYCAAQEALLRVGAALLTAPDLRVLRLLAPSSQVGSVVGKGGARINAIRKDTDTRVKVGVPEEERPALADEDDQVVIIEGSPVPMLHALKAVSIALREGQARVQNKKIGGGMGGYGLPAGGMYGAPSHPMGPAYMAAPMMPMGMPQRSFSGGVGSMNVDGNGGASMRITISRDQVGAVLGPRGSNIQQVRSISGAKVKLHDAEGPTGGRELEISGSLEQMQTAHSMVHNFLQAATAN